VNDDSGFVVIGRVRRAHGTRGEVSVEPITDFPERIFSLREVLIKGRGGEVRAAGVEEARRKGDLTLLKLAGVDDRTSAESLAGCLVGVRREDVPPAGEDEYYHFDLLGCAVVDEKGAEVGTVTDVLRMPANDVLVVATGGGEALIPTVKQVVKRVDIRARIITIERIPGLLDE
jgi:16S rRNA processing protein RimM